MLELLVAALLSQAPAANPGPVRAAERHDGVPVGAGKEPATVRLTEPTGGWTVGRMLTVAGTVSDHTINPVVVSINGDRYLLRTFDGQFKRDFPAAAGK